MDKNRFLIIDGNSIMNRAFYGVMGSKMLSALDGTPTNAIYGFLSILFKQIENLNPKFLVVTFDLKAPTQRHIKYERYKANRHGMPDELRVQMPIIKDVLKKMNISIIEKEGYEADDCIGTLAKRAEKEGLKVTILSGDRDTFQLASENITIRIPRTKAGKTEEEDITPVKIMEKYGLTPEQMIELKALMGDSSDNIPGVPGVGEKTALTLIKNYGSVEKLYKAIETNTDDLKGKTREKIAENKELAELSKFLGTINLNVPITEKLDEFILDNWLNVNVYQIFKALRFNRFIERFNLSSTGENTSINKEKEILTKSKIIDIEDFVNIFKNEKDICYLFNYKDVDNSSITNKEPTEIYAIKENTVYASKINGKIYLLKEILENENIKKIGYELKQDKVILNDYNITLKGLKFDIKLAGYCLNPGESKYDLKDLITLYLNKDIDFNYNKDQSKKLEQLGLFNEVKEEPISEENMTITGFLFDLYNVMKKKLTEENILNLFNTIEMPLISVLAEMQISGIYADKEQLEEIGNNLKQDIENLSKEIYELAGEEFNINSPKQLGSILFEKLELPIIKKNKNGYSTDSGVLEKLKLKHPIIKKILEYRTITKLNSTYVQGLIVYINKNTNSIHSSFNQTITATGRLSCSEPNLQNIPTKFEQGKQLRKIFKARPGKVFIDADYSQIELRLLAHISGDENMIYAFNNNEDIHRQVASKVFNVPYNEVTKEQRSRAKAVNFGIVYGISDFGLAQQIGVSKKMAGDYINQYLEKYNGIKQYMDKTISQTKENGYITTLYNRKRYVPEINSNNYLVRQFGERVAMNTPIQGTAADIMKIAMINVSNRLKRENIKGKILLQIHDELLLEVDDKDKEKAKKVLKDEMENVAKFSVPLVVEMSEANNWYEAK